jgi:hypothetical protein
MGCGMLSTWPNQSKSTSVGTCLNACKRGAGMWKRRLVTLIDIIVTIDPIIPSKLVRFWSIWSFDPTYFLESQHHIFKEFEPNPNLAINLRRKPDIKKPDPQTHQKKKKWSEWYQWTKILWCQVSHYPPFFLTCLAIFLEHIHYILIWFSPPHLLQHGPHNFMKRNPCKSLASGRYCRGE